VIPSHSPIAAFVHELTFVKPSHEVALLKHAQSPAPRTQHTVPVAEVVGTSSPFRPRAV